MKWRVRIFAWALAAGLLIYAGACKPSQPAEDDVTFSDEGEGITESSPVPETAVPTSRPEAVPEGMNLAECPGRFGLLSLKFSADIDFNAAGASLHHTLGDGVLLLEVSEDKPQVIIQSQNPVTLPVTINGTVGDCSLSGESSMIASASGYCENGIVHLIIEENWQSGSGVLTCPDRNPANFPLVGAGSMTHRGADGRGEVFYLDWGFSDQNIGYMLEKPFLGQGGSGTHTWTLMMEPFQPIMPVSTP
ncbi:hypothetical protein BECAL_00449 [Bellilinea caldifistulae]|uniref:Uncharacterized protein n=2 Tax=Bellilinea caldifistulae TaxID=360411 RepID=A0A0N8GMF9_9CHLR|nr:hypothetical protein [Bellilinea caldifistulae]KPL75186.1 hypothetical protein AC812_09425 [Bellilinea caldifistulae]GAP09307.1 hypothetical protein BECAL_00449 [Bellilinea caldifistulae]